MIYSDFHVDDKLCLKREWAEAKKELQEERDNVRTLTLDREKTLKNAMSHVEDMGKELANALHATAAAEARAAVAEVLSSPFLFSISIVDAFVYRFSMSIVPFLTPTFTYFSCP